ncbi:hypothetical protein [Sorangium sp. So ce1000]
MLSGNPDTGGELEIAVVKACQSVDDSISSVSNEVSENRIHESTAE